MMHSIHPLHVTSYSGQTYTNVATLLLDSIKNSLTYKIVIVKTKMGIFTFTKSCICLSHSMEQLLVSVNPLLCFDSFCELNMKLSDNPVNLTM